MFGDGDIEPSKDNAMVLVEEACGLDLPMQLCQKLARLDFESRKDAAQASADPTLCPCTAVPCASADCVNTHCMTHAC